MAFSKSQYIQIGYDKHSKRSYFNATYGGVIIDDTVVNTKLREQIIIVHNCAEICVVAYMHA